MQYFAAGSKFFNLIFGAASVCRRAKSVGFRSKKIEVSLEHPLNLIWRRQSLEKVLEGHFIKEVLLGKIGRPIRTVLVEPRAPVPILSNSLFVSFGTELANALEEARARGATNLGLFHMADERGDDDRTFYSLADYVLRNYWFKQAMVSSGHSLGVVWVPNGYRTGVGPINTQTMLPAGERKIMGFFAGALQSRTLADERQSMIEAIRDADLPFLIAKSASFGGGLGPVSYASYLSMSRFGLVPGGNSPETIRLYDVLEAGAIPVMLRSPFVHAPDALNNPPFALLDTWAELPKFYARYASANDPETIAEIEKMRGAVVVWWKAFKKKHQMQVKELVDRSFARADG